MRRSGRTGADALCGCGAFHTPRPGSFLQCDLCSTDHCTPARWEQTAWRHCLSTFAFSMQNPKRAEAWRPQKALLDAFATFIYAARVAERFIDENTLILRQFLHFSYLFFFCFFKMRAAQKKPGQKAWSALAACSVMGTSSTGIDSFVACKLNASTLHEFSPI